MSELSKTSIYQILLSRQEFLDEYKEKLEFWEGCLTEEYQKIQVYFENYTKHDWVHSNNVLEYMYKLIVSPEKIKTETLMLMVFCALLHDIGMAFNEDDIRELQKTETSLTSQIMQNKEEIRKYLRLNHGRLARYKIEKIKNKANKPDALKLMTNDSSSTYDYSYFIERICESHTHSPKWLSDELKNNDDCEYVACLLRLADLLDIDGKRADYYYQLSRQLEEESSIQFTLNQVMGGNQKIESFSVEPCSPDCKKTNCGGCGKQAQKIVLRVTMPANFNPSYEARIRRMICDYSGEIEQEIESVDKILSGLDIRYHLSLISSVDIVDNVPKATSCPQIDSCKIRIDYASIRDFLYGNHLYPEPIYGIREIIQNCYDAIKSSCLSSKGIGWKPTILLRYDRTTKTFSIFDNGIGMTDFVIKEYLLNIGRSIYTSDTEDTGIQPLSDHIGYFGLGFYAIFMLVNHAIIVTKSNSENDVAKIEIDKSINYATIITEKDPDREHGTEIILNMRDISNALECRDEQECCELICNYIQETFLFDGIAIIFEEFDNGIKVTNTAIELPNIEKCIWKDDIGAFLSGINAKANIGNRTNDSIYFVELIDNKPQIKHISYDDLLVTLQKELKTSRQIPYMNMGDFSLFTTDENLISEWTKINEKNDGRINYTSFSTIGGGINIKLKEFCEAEKIITPTHCDVLTLQLLVNGRNVALCVENVVCSKHTENMLKFDACGKAPYNDKVFLRNVALPKVHITLPWLNYRYLFNELIINVRTNNVFPILTRDDLTNQQKKDLNYALGYAISSISRNDLENAENQLIINEYYSITSNNIFMKKRR